jgi:hypothetical protein
MKKINLWNTIFNDGLRFTLNGKVRDQYFMTKLRQELIWCLMDLRDHIKKYND